jgi:uridine kinase
MIEHDAYYLDQGHLPREARDEVNFDHPASLESALLAHHLGELRAGREVEVPMYDFVSHTRKRETRRVAPAPVIIVEGILVFADAALRAQMDLKIFVDTDADIRLMRRILRDIDERGETFHSVRDHYYATVRPMHLEHVEPTKRLADLILPEGGDNNVALEVVLGQLWRVVRDEPG